VAVGILLAMLSAGGNFLLLPECGFHSYQHCGYSCVAISESSAVAACGAGSFGNLAPNGTRPLPYHGAVVAGRGGDLQSAQCGGFFLLERLRRRRSVPVDSKLQEICMTLQKKLGLARAIRYAQCDWLDAPAVIGWFRPIVFLPLTA